MDSGLFPSSYIHVKRFCEDLIVLMFPKKNIHSGYSKPTFISLVIKYPEKKSILEEKGSILANHYELHSMTTWKLRL